MDSVRNGYTLGVRRNCRNCRNCVARGTEESGTLVVRCREFMWGFVYTTWRSILNPYSTRLAKIAQWCPKFTSMSD